MDFLTGKALSRRSLLRGAGATLALPLLETAGSTGLGDPVFDEIFHPIGERVARRCDACLRIGGASAGAEAMVAIFRQAGRPVYRSLAEVPGCA